MRKLIIVLLVCFCQVSIGQVYQSMPQYGYSAPRMNFDSTLTIPTTNGVPTLKSNITRKGALAIDSTNGRFYFYNPKTLVWDTIRGGTGTASDTASVVKALVHNQEATTLTKGSVVYLYGASGNVASVKRAYNTSDTFSSKTFAIVKEDIGAGQRGIVITQGVVDKLQLGSYSEGDIVWLDSIPGKFTKNKPSAPYHQVFIGVVERANNGNGQLYVKVQNGYELGELHNVSINGQADNDVLYYQSSTRLWKAKSAYQLVDTSGLSSRINVKLTASDTASLSNRINTKLNLSDSTLYQTKFRSDTARTNTYSAIAGKFTLPSLTSGSVLFSNGTTIAQKNANLFWDNTNNRLGIGTSSPSMTLDVSGRTNISYSATTDFPLNIRNTNSSAVTANVLSFDCSATGADQPVLVTLGSSNPKGISFFASNQAVTASPVAAAFQMFSNSATNFPGQLYFDAGATNNGAIIFRSAQTAGTITQRMRIFSNGNVNIGSTTTDAGYLLNVQGTIRGTQFFLSALNTAPASATATGTLGEIRIDANYIYICTATNTWKRAAIATW